MVTGVEAMNNVLNETPEEKAARIKKARQDGMAKARAVKAEKMESGELVISPKAKHRGEFWYEVFLTFMRNREVRGSKDIPAIIKETDDTMEILKEADKI